MDTSRDDLHYFFYLDLSTTCDGIKQTLQAKTMEYLSFLRQKILGETIKSHQENYQDVKIGKHISRLLDFTRESRNCVNYIMGNFLPVIIGSICIILYFLNLI